MLGTKSTLGSLHRCPCVALLSVTALARLASGQVVEQDASVVAESVFVAVANLKAYQASAFARHRTFSRVPPAALSSSSAQIEILGATDSGWSAVGFWKATPTIRCAIRVGREPAFFSLAAPDGEGIPQCIGAAGRLLDFGGQLSTSHLYWWHDAALDTWGQQVDCPPLRLRQRPSRNDTLYLEFIVDGDGRVVPANVTVGSSGDMAPVIAGLLRLSECRFEPARLRGQPVLTLVQQTLALAPDRPARTHDQPAASVFEYGVPDNWQSLYEARSALHALRRAQERYRVEHGTYSPGLGLEEYLRPDSALQIVILRWSPVGWSAVAVHDSVSARCAIAVGEAPFPLAVPADSTDAVQCFTVGGRKVTTVADSLTRRHALLDGPLEPPRRQRCNTNVRFRNRDLRDQWAALEFVVDTDGMVEPASVRVVASSGLRAAAAATQMVSGCRYDPGTIGGLPVRVMIRQPIEFR